MGALTSEEFGRRLAMVLDHDSDDKSDLKKEKRYDSDMITKYVKFESATLQPRATATFLMTVEMAHCNVFNTLHGGCIALIMDVTSSLTMASLSQPGFWDESMGGVSRNLDIRYLQPVMKGRDVRITVELVHAGKRSALLSIRVTDAETGKIYALGEHDKVNYVNATL
ncbi:hypothetical protein KEM54_002290 [Ascosphaera aggregata]|nr:hypothetical protein KEM54_002290 [Ascosphaera aggregata]